MAELTVNGRIKVKTFQKEFIAKFPHLVPTLRTDEGHGIDNDLTIAAARVKAKGEYTPSGESDLSINGHLTVGGFETRFKNAFGITCQICYSKGGRTMQTNEKYNEMTLSEANAKLKADGADEITL